MARKKKEPKTEEQVEREAPRRKSIDLELEFNPDPTSEDALHVHSLVRQLNEFKQTLLEYDYRGWTPSAVEHVFHVEFEESELSPETLDAVYEGLGISHRRSKHPYQKSQTTTLHEALQDIRKRREDNEED